MAPKKTASSTKPWFFDESTLTKTLDTSQTDFCQTQVWTTDH
jgi:hypothetical protein